ncbi:MAG TPA: dihydrofolate reductase family protein [Solirubrobacteraceae bacterium]
MSPARELQPLQAGDEALTLEAFVERLGLWEGAAHSDERPRVLAGMVGSADGRATVEGRAGGLSNAVDRGLLRALRAPVDAMLVGAGTLIAEGYANLVDAGQRELRVARGLPATPLLATISRGLTPALAQIPLFGETGQRIVVFTESHEQFPSCDADVVLERFHPGELTARGCLRRLRASGVRTVLSEGGPTLLHELVRERLLDELILTIAALLVAGDGRSVLHGPVFDPPVALRLDDIARAEDYLFLRYVPLA